MEMQKGDEPIFLNRASRATRGKRMTKLVDEEIEEDDQFWNQEALKEEEEDTNYQEEGEVADVFDSDFDEDEPEPDEDVEKEPDDRKQPRKRLMYPGKQLPKRKKKKKKILSALDGAIQDEPTPEQSTFPEDHDTPEDIEVEKTVRKSTRTSVIVRQAEREAIRAAVQATMKPIKKRKEGEQKRMTQEEMLLEAAQTEIMNLRNLERVLAREEEVKKRAIVHKAVYTGPQIRYFSRDGCTYLEYNNGASFESQISTKSAPYPEKAVCAVTGLPAKYRDPKTGLPYATKEAFKIIREKFSNENSSIDEEKIMGIEHGLTCEPGFTKKKKRSVNPNSREISYGRFFSRFRRIPAIEIEDSE